MLRCALVLVAAESAASLMMPMASTRSVATTPRFSPLTMEVKIEAKTVKALRDQTGAGMMDCKKALVEAEGDTTVALEALRARGLAQVDKKSGRAASEGTIETYIHTGAKLGVMIEVNCETDFVAKSTEFQELAKALAMQVAACPTVEVVDASAIPGNDEIFVGARDRWGAAIGRHQAPLWLYFFWASPPGFPANEYAPTSVSDHFLTTFSDGCLG